MYDPPAEAIEGALLWDTELDDPCIWLELEANRDCVGEPVGD